MKKILLSLLALTLVGCSYPLQLHSRDGTGTGQGLANSGDKSMKITLGGTVYSGKYVFDGGSVATTNMFGTATAYGRAGTATAYVQSFGTTFIPGSNQGQAFLMAPDGSSLRCRFMYKDSNGLGECESNSGKVYDLVIGSPS